MDSLAEKRLLFNPSADSAISPDVPRYLFRVVSPFSDGKTDGSWVRSMAACQNLNSSSEDIFSRLSDEKRKRVAHTLNQHLRWWSKEGVQDNFVSWTSPLLFAIQYIYFRHLSTNDSSRLEEIKLYVIDTTLFRKRTFLRDLDLIRVFRGFDTDLKDFSKLRNTTPYYFGEYLSQRSLKIESKHMVLSAQKLFENDRLRRSPPCFYEFHQIPIRGGKPSWPKDVIRFRKEVWLSNSSPLSRNEVYCRLEAVEEILIGLAPSWKYPLAIYFAALTGLEAESRRLDEAGDNVLYAYFRSISLQDAHKRFSPSNFEIFAANTMPELEHVEKLIQQIHAHCTLKQALEYIENAEVTVRNLHISNIFNARNNLPVANYDCFAVREKIVLKLATVQMLCEEVAQAKS
ncbi:hypothetical protein BO82DRAFT_379522 [Aspergillus uvarum CBS 121591]|uniref:DUF7587 domain-containing protein n=1 Tax=Aspergillus uvarum CBS 121591 TaxID=1448315 RepID=A0A319BQ04_9EURO|nr:hypothetical protein BO82DRAFT_379522 [Aspergillus uvarum CBS 121591]PYH75516.1 hypothetical protein BO82DRAFT_379522 [Aspergillus uvarum CBS 121591]